MSAGIFSYHTAQPFKVFGLEGDFWLVHIDILIATWIAMGCILLLILLGRYCLHSKRTLIALGYEKTILIFMDLCKESFGSFNYYYFAFIATIFFFTFFCCLVGVIPFVEEATRDINTTLALALTSFFYVQYQKIKVHGIKGFLREFIEPFAIMLPLHIVGELSKIASMSFRLFGNILGGGFILVMIIGLLNQYKGAFMIAMAAIILLHIGVRTIPRLSESVVLKTVSTILSNALFIIAWVQLALGIFEGMIQSFVLTMLTITYLAIGTQHESPHEQKETS